MNNINRFNVMLRSKATVHMKATAHTTLSLNGLSKRVRNSVITSLQQDYTPYYETSESGGLYAMLCTLYGWKPSMANEERKTVSIQLPVDMPLDAVKELRDSLEAFAMLSISDKEIASLKRGRAQMEHVFAIKGVGARQTEGLRLHSWCVPKALPVARVMEFVAPYRTNMRDPEQVADAIAAVKEGRVFNWNAGVLFA